MVTPLPTVVLLATGGTIAGAGGSRTGPGYRPATLTAEDLLDAVPELASLAVLESEELSRVGSQDMTEALWIDLARRVAAHLERPEVAGVVVTHGTDTLEETAFFLDRVVASEKPVVLTGAMRPATGVSADGPRNLLDSVRVASAEDARGRGALVVIDESIHSGRAVAKMNTTYVSTFRSPNFGLEGSVVAGRPVFLRARPRTRTHHFERVLTSTEQLPPVHVLYAHVGQDPRSVRAALELGAKGLVLAGVGNGNAPLGVIDALARAVREGIPVVRSTRTGSGFVSRNVEIDDDALGFIASRDLSPQKARILLKLALLETGDPQRIRAYFQRD